MKHLDHVIQTEGNFKSPAPKSGSIFKMDKYKQKHI